MNDGPIVVGVDGSIEAAQAVALAWRLAEASGSPLHLVTAVQDALADVVATKLGLDADSYHQSQMAETLGVIRKSLQTVVPESVLASGLVGRIGRPEKVLADYGAEVRAGIVVVGGTTRSGLLGWLDRGTAHFLLRTTQTPLLIAGPGSASIERVIVALDLSRNAPAAARFATWFAQLLGVTLKAVHVIDDNPFKASSGVTTATRVEYVRLANARAVDAIWPLLDPGTPREVMVGPVSETLDKIVRSGGSTLLVVGSHGLGRVDRLLLGSTTEALLSDLPGSLAIVPFPRETT